MALTSKIEKLNTQWNEARRVSHSREACDPDVVRFAFQIKAKVITGEGVPANKRIAVQMYLLEMWLRERGVKVPPQR